jgi:hypothetical protein
MIVGALSLVLLFIADRNSQAWLGYFRFLLPAPPFWSQACSRSGIANVGSGSQRRAQPPWFFGRRAPGLRLRARRVRYGDELHRALRCRHILPDEVVVLRSAREGLSRGGHDCSGRHARHLAARDSGIPVAFGPIGV